MRDPLLISEDEPVPEHRLPRDKKELFYGTVQEPRERDHKQVLRDLMLAFDQYHELKKKQYRDKDLLLNELMATRKKLDRANLQLWIMGLFVSPLLGILVKFVIEKMIR